MTFSRIDLQARHMRIGYGGEASEGEGVTLQLRFHRFSGQPLCEQRREIGVRGRQKDTDTAAESALSLSERGGSGVSSCRHGAVSDPRADF